MNTLTNQENFIYYNNLIRIKLTPGLGDTFGKIIASQIRQHPDLLDYSPNELKKLFPSCEKRMIRLITDSQQDTFKDAIRYQWDIIDKHDIHIISYDDENYPENLKEIPGAPLMLFYKGAAALSNAKNISIIGTRKNSEWAKTFTEKLIDDLKSYQPQIISGLALGIDSIAHKSAIQNDIPTIAVMANGILNIYPSQNKKLADEIISKGGGLLSEHLPNTFPDKQNFPLRNRIVAGISMLTLLIESPLKGGSMITGKLAAAFNREVGAVPGRPNDEKSEGCNYLIHSNIAQLVRSAEDVAYIMGWDIKKKKNSTIQLKMYSDLNSDEMEIVEFMKNNPADFFHIDELMIRLNKSNTELASVLLNLELQGHVQTLSGKRYKLL